MKVHPVKPLGKSDLEARAEAILEEFDPDALKAPKSLDVLKLVDVHLYKKHRWSLSVEETLPPNVLGYCDPKNKTLNVSAATYEEIKSGVGRARFTGCHEYAHVALHARQMAVNMISFDERTEHLYRKDRNELKAYQDPEWQADYLAGCLLMPAPMVRLLARSNRGEELVSLVTASFGVSRQAAEVRIRKLGLYR